MWLKVELITPINIPESFLILMTFLTSSNPMNKPTEYSPYVRLQAQDQTLSLIRQEDWFIVLFVEQIVPVLSRLEAQCWILLQVDVEIQARLV